MRLADARIVGIFPLQHKKFKNKNWDLQLRASIGGVRVTDRYDTNGDLGYWEVDKNSVGDIHGGQLWEKDSREIPMWRFATPVKIGKPGRSNTPTPGTTGTPTPGSTGGVRPGTATPNGSRGAGPGLGGSILTGGQLSGNSLGSSLPGGAVLLGAGAGVSRPTVFEGTGPGTSQPGQTEADPPVNGGAAPPVCGTSPDGDFVMFPILDGNYTTDERLKELKPAIYKDGGERMWPKFPKSTVGISLTANDEEDQVDLFHPTDPRLVAVNKAGDKEMGSKVFDLNADFEYDKDRGVPLQSMMWVLKKPLGDSNAIAWQLGPSGCKDTRGGYVIDDNTGGLKGKSQNVGAGAGQSRPTVTQENTGPATPKDKVIGRVSRNHGGPFDVGSGNCRHVSGRDADGNLISRLHLDIDTLFRQDDAHDGELMLESWKPGEDQDKAVPVHFGWNPGAKKWAWWSTTMMRFTPTPPPTIPPLFPHPVPNYDNVHPFDPVGSPVSTGGGITPFNQLTGGGINLGGLVSGEIAAADLITGGFNVGGGAEPGAGGGGGTSGPGTSSGGGNTPLTNEPSGGGESTGGDGAGKPGSDLQDLETIEKNKDDLDRFRESQDNLWKKLVKPQSAIMTQGANLGYALMDQATGFGQILAKPYNYESGMANIANLRNVPTDLSNKYATTNPITASLTAFGAQGGVSSAIASNPTAPAVSPSLPPASPNPVPSPLPSPTPSAPPTSPTTSPVAASPVTTTPINIGATGDPWDYTWNSYGAPLVGGTAPGGFVLTPPEVDPGDGFTADEGAGPVSSSSIGVGPGASFFAGAPDLASGKPKDCMSWTKDTASGDLIFNSHYGAAAGIEGVRISHQGQNISFKSRTSYKGTLRHANSADRDWFFPNIGGGVLVCSNNDEVGWGATPTLHSIGGSGPTVANQDSWARTWINGTVYWIPLWR